MGTRDHERSERLQVMVSAEELAAVDEFRFENRLPSRAAAVRELMRRGLLPAPSRRRQAALERGAAVSLRKHPIAQDRWATFAAPGKLDDSLRDGLASPEVAIDVKSLADFLIRHGHRLNIAGLECAG